MISDLTQDDWPFFLVYEPSVNQIFVAVDQSVIVYDRLTCERSHKLKDIHTSCICLVKFYPDFNYLITCGKDGTIKIWNSQSCLVHFFHAHAGIITGIELLADVCEASPRTVPVILTSSLDGTLRMHDVDTGGLLYSLDTYSPCLGLFKVRKDTFLHWSGDSVHVWSLNRFHSTFTFLRYAAHVFDLAEISQRC